MPFLDHLEELRWTILKSLVAVLAGILLCWAFTDGIYLFLLRPLDAVESEVTLVFGGPLDAFMVKLKMAVLAGTVLAAPLIFGFVWSFLRPALRPQERRLGWWTVTAGTMFFLLGAGFAYVSIPMVLRFLVSFSPGGVTQLWQLRTYIDFVFRLVVACGILFELPVVMVLVVRLDLVSVDTLARGRPYAIVLAFLVAAVLTPPDIFTQIMLGVPLVLLYELGLIAGRWLTARSHS